MALILDRTVNKCFHLNPRLRPPVRSADEFDIKKYMSPGKPRRRIHKLHLNPAGPAILSCSRGNLRLERARA